MELLRKVKKKLEALKGFSVINSHVNISRGGQVFWPTKGTGGLQHHNFLIFDGKQHPKKNLVPWMLKSPLTSVLKYLVNP